MKKWIVIVSMLVFLMGCVVPVYAENEQVRDIDADAQLAFGTAVMPLCQEVIQNMYHPRTFELRNAELWPFEENSNIYFLRIEYAAENRVGGRTPGEYFLLVRIEEDGNTSYMSYSANTDEANFNSGFMAKVLEYQVNEAEFHATSKKPADLKEYQNTIMTYAIIFLGC